MKRCSDCKYSDYIWTGLECKLYPRAHGEGYHLALVAREDSEMCGLEGKHWATRPPSKWQKRWWAFKDFIHDLVRS